MTNIIDDINNEQLNANIPDFGPGDTVVVQVKIKEGNRERLQAYEGVVIAKRNRGLHSAFTVRKMSYGEGVERVFQTHSPLIDSVTVKRRGLLEILKSPCAEMCRGFFRLFLVKTSCVYRIAFWHLIY